MTTAARPVSMGDRAPTDEPALFILRSSAGRLLKRNGGVVVRGAHKGTGPGESCRIRSANPVRMTVMVDTKMSKSAGEHWTCAALSLLGWGVALTRDGLERTDILAVQTTGDRRMIEVQVKAARGLGDKVSWPLGPTPNCPRFQTANGLCW